MRNRVRSCHQLHAGITPRFLPDTNLVHRKDAINYWIETIGLFHQIHVYLENQPLRQAVVLHLLWMCALGNRLHFWTSCPKQRRLYGASYYKIISKGMIWYLWFPLNRWQAFRTPGRWYKRFVRACSRTIAFKKPRFRLLCLNVLRKEQQWMKETHRSSSKTGVCHRQSRRINFPTSCQFRFCFWFCTSIFSHADNTLL